jgi:UDP-N-acetylmuramate dehydrogenase
MTSKMPPAESDCFNNSSPLHAGDFETNRLAGSFTTFGIGGPIKYFASAEDPEALAGAIAFAKQEDLPWVVIGEGSNLLVADEGFGGVVIENSISHFEDLGNGEFFIGSGNNLWQTIDDLVAEGWSGMEKMSGIPGSVGGAIYGNAGAYGQETKDVVKSVIYFDTEAETFDGLSNEKCEFKYRDSIFKCHKQWVITGCKIWLQAGEAGLLADEAAEIVSARKEKYPPGLKCPGSFFKNIFYANLPQAAQAMIPEEKVKGGKVASGYLIDECGLRGKKVGGVRISDIHGNLFVNDGNATAKDVLTLASLARQAVWEKFEITLKPEVQLLGDILLPDLLK